MGETLHEGQKKSKLRAVASWSWHHRVVSLQLLLLMICGILLLIQPVSFQIFFFNAQNCGMLSRSDTIVSTSDQANEAVGKQDIRCFVQAHQQCTAATLTMSLVGVDRGSTVTFRTSDGLGGCTLSELAYGSVCVAPAPFCGPYIDANCRAMQEEQDGLHFLDCGDRPDSVFRI